jgi:hypothetical protein
MIALLNSNIPRYIPYILVSIFFGFIITIIFWNLLTSIKFNAEVRLIIIKIKRHERIFMGMHRNIGIININSLSGFHSSTNRKYGLKTKSHGMV